MKNIILKITRNSELDFSACRFVGDDINSWKNTIKVRVISGGKAVKSGYLHIIARPDNWVCISNCIFNLDDSDFLFSIEDESAKPIQLPIYYIMSSIGENYRNRLN